MAKTCYVIHARTGLVQHEGTQESCDLYVRNSTDLFGAGPFIVAVGAADCELVKRHIRDNNA